MADDLTQPASYAEWRTATEAGARVAAVPVFKQFVVEVEILPERQVRFTITTSAPDRERDVVVTDGIDTTAYATNPVVMWAHDYHAPPIGRCTQIERQADRLIATVQFMSADISPFADQIYRMVQAGYLRAASIGFKPLEWAYDEERRGVNFLRCELLEFSVCPIPANSEALLAADLEPGVAVLRAWAEEVLTRLDPGQGTKGVSPRDVSTDQAPEDQGWSAPRLSDFTNQTWGDLTATERRRIAGHYAWAAQMPPDSFGSLKLPHHDPKNGHVVWRGVVASAARMNQVSIPADDMEAVKAHIRRHYKAFRPDADLPDTLASVPPFDRDPIGWKAYEKARERAQRRAGDVELTDVALANLLDDYGFESEALALSGEQRTGETHPVVSAIGTSVEAVAETAEQVVAAAKAMDRETVMTACRACIMACTECVACCAGYAAETSDAACQAACEACVVLAAKTSAACTTCIAACAGEAEQEGETIEMAVKSGRVLSKKNEDILREAVQSAQQCADRISSVLAAVETDEGREATAVDDVLLQFDDDDVGQLETELCLRLAEDDDPGEPLIEVDRDELAGVMKDMLRDLVQRETQVVVSRLRGRVD